MLAAPSIHPASHHRYYYHCPLHNSHTLPSLSPFAFFFFFFLFPLLHNYITKEKKATKMMQLGKRPRPAMAMRRTTSMTGITVVVDPPNPPPPSDSVANGGPHHTVDLTMDNHYLASMVSPRNIVMNHNPHHHMRSVSMESTAHFLRTCGLCKRRLAPSNDIYMYRGDTGFCSLECREEQMKKDARKEKYQQRSKLAAVTNSSSNINRDDIITIGGTHPTSSPVPTSTS